MLSKFLASLIEFLAGFGKALPTIADNQRTRLEIKRPAKEARAKFVSYNNLRAHETKANLVCRLLLAKKKRNKTHNTTHE